MLVPWGSAQKISSSRKGNRGHMPCCFPGKSKSHLAKSLRGRRKPAQTLLHRHGLLVQLVWTDAALTTQDKHARGGRPRKQMTREGHPQISGQQGTLNPADVETGSAYLSLPCSSYGPRPSSLSETQPHQVNEPATGPPPPTPSGALNPLQRDRTLLGHQVWFRICEARVVSPGQYAGLGKGYKG